MRAIRCCINCITGWFRKNIFQFCYRMNQMPEHVWSTHYIVLRGKIGALMKMPCFLAGCVPIPLNTRSWERRTLFWIAPLFYMFLFEHPYFICFVLGIENHGSRNTNLAVVFCSTLTWTAPLVRENWIAWPLFSQKQCFEKEQPLFYKFHNWRMTYHHLLSWTC